MLTIKKIYCITKFYPRDKAFIPVKCGKLFHLRVHLDWVSAIAHSGTPILKHSITIDRVAAALFEQFELEYFLSSGKFFEYYLYIYFPSMRPKDSSPRAANTNG